MIDLRRKFLRLSAAGAAAAVATRGSAMTAVSVHRIRAVAFDGLAVFDLRPVAALAERHFGEKGSELAGVWRTRQFEYSWLRTAMDRYADFWQVTEEALVFAARSAQVGLTPRLREELMQSFLEIRAWDDAPRAIASLREAGYRVALLSNFTRSMLRRAVRNSALGGLFDFLLSTDYVRAYKPDPRAYAMGTQAFDMRPQEIAFVAYAGWDAAGARAFGYPTYWANRLGAADEELGVRADATAANLDGLAAFVGAGRAP